MEILKLFADVVYGPPVPAEQPQLLDERVIDHVAFDGLASIHHYTLKALDRTLNVTLFLPQGDGPHPVFVGLNRAGNHAVTNHPGVPEPAEWKPTIHRQQPFKRGEHADHWAVNTILSRGWGLATVFGADACWDRTDARGPADAKAIASWAWLYSRVVDHLLTLKTIDPKRIAVYGHSRRGKTALWAAANDERIRYCACHQSGTGGAKLSRHFVGETVKQITDTFPHWFVEEFAKYAGRENDLPLDQHMLIACVAPRVVMLSNGVEDEWSDPAGQFLAARYADPVYKLLGTDGLTLTDPPSVGDKSLGRLGYALLPGNHTCDERYWNLFLDHAEKTAKAD